MMLTMDGEGGRKLVAGAAGPAVGVPHSVQAEQALLGAVIVNNRLLDDLEGTLLAEHFYVPLHAEMFRVIGDIVGHGREANPISIRERLKGTSFDADEKLFPHLTQMFEHAGVAGDVSSLAEVIQTAFTQRQLMGLCDSGKQAAQAAKTPEDVKAVIEGISSEAFRLSEAPGGKSTVRGMREGLLSVITNAEAAKRNGGGLSGVASGYQDVDDVLGGFQRSDFIVVGARPSMGKTSLLLNMAQAAALRKARNEEGGAAVGVFSLEMSSEQLYQRVLAGESEVSTQQMGSGRLGDGDFQRMTAAAMKLKDVPLYVDDTPGLSIAALRSRARRMKRQYGIGLLVVDYLQLMTAAGFRPESKVLEISAISQGLKQVARELDIPVVVASQLSRQVEQRENKRPQLSDLRDSGSIEQDADVVAMLYRAEYYISKQLGVDDGSSGDAKKQAELRAELERVRGVTEFIISKNRKGPTETVKLIFDGANTRFRDARVGAF